MDNTKTLNIEIPKGYKIDQEKSNLAKGKIVFKEIEKELPKTWEELERIKGHYVTENSSIDSEEWITTHSSKNLFATREQAEASLALAQLSQLREVYRQGWKPNWEDKNQEKYGIFIDARDMQMIIIPNENISFFSFQDYETALEFRINFEELINKTLPLRA